MFGIHGMHETVIAGLFLKPGVSTMLEKITREDVFSNGPSIIKTVETKALDPDMPGPGERRNRLQPVSLERVSQLGI